MQVMLLSTKEYWNINLDRKLFNKLFQELEYLFLVCLIRDNLFSSTEITDFSSQLYFFLANIKSKIWQIYVILRHHCQSTRGSYLPLLIFFIQGHFHSILLDVLDRFFFSATAIRKNIIGSLTTSDHGV